MRTRTLTLLTVLVLVIAACGDEGGDSSTTSRPGTDTTAASGVEAVLLSYALEPGTTYEYEVDMDQTIEMTSTGDTTAMGEDDLPGELEINMVGTADFTHTVSEGPEPGTFEVAIVGDFADMEFTGTVDGEPVEESDIPDMAQMEPVDVTVIVDEQGNVIPDESEGLGGDMFGDLGGLDMLQSLGGGSAALGQFVGPPLSEEEVTVGDTWSKTIEIPTLPASDPVTTQIDSEVVGTEELDGSEVFVIDTTTTTSEVEFDLAQILVGFMTAFVPEDATDEERAEMDALVEQLRFVISVDETTGELTTLFDPADGLTKQADYSNTTHMVMDVNIPDETTGDLAAFGMDLDITQDLVYRLVGSGSA
jgi:hypothetical protein